MLKRLLTAVFVLGIFLALNGTAFSDIGPVNPTKDRLHPQVTVNPSKAKVLHPNVASLPRLKNVIANEPPTPNRPSTNEADTVACYSQDWWSDNTGAANIPFYDAGGAWLTDKISMRMDGPSQQQHVAVVDNIWAVIRFAKRAGGAPGLPIRISIYDDLAGYPGSLLYTADYALPNVTAATGFNFLLPTPLTVTGSYHVALGYGPTAVSTDSLNYRLGIPTGPNGPAAQTARTKYYDGASLAWFDIEDVWTVGGFASTVWMSADQCEIYSECYSNYGASPYYFWATPDNAWSDGSTMNGFARRFVAPGPETLKTIWVYHYVPISAGYPTGLYAAGAGTNSIKVSLFADSVGTIDKSTGATWTTTISGLANLFPGGGPLVKKLYVIPVTVPNIVVYGGYHVGVEATSALPSDGQFGFLSDDLTGTDGSVYYSAPGNGWARFYNSTTWTSDIGTDGDVALDVDVCKDEFYDCHTEVLNHGLAYAYTFQNPAYGFLLDEVAQKVTASQVNRVDKIRFFVNRRGVAPLMDLRIYSDGGIDPGPVVWDSTFPIPANGWYEKVIPGGFQINGDFFVGYASTSAGTDSLRAVTDNGGGGFVNGGARFNLQTYGWLSTADIYADPTDEENLAIEVDYCSVIIPGWTCVVGDWPTNAGDYARTGHSGVALSDAYCDLNILWTYTDPGFGNTAAGGGAIGANAPIIWDTFVVCVQNSKINILNLNTGVVLGTFSGNVAPYYIAVSLVRSTPTIATINVLGVPTPVLFYGGGSSMMAVKMIPGFPVLWELRGATAVAHGFTTSEINSGFTNNSAPVVANISGVDYVYWGTGNAQILAANAETGNKVWARTLVSNPVRNLAFDGTKLYTATIAAPPTILDGDVYAIVAATGVIDWQLSVDGALVGTTGLGSTNESFADQLAVFDGSVFAVSAYFTPVFDDEGNLYIIDANAGSVIATAPTQHFYQGGGLTVGANVMMDATRVIVAGGSTWTSTPMGGTVISHNRYNGSLDWISDAGVAKTTGGNLSNGFITCEGDGDGQIFLFNVDGYLSSFDLRTGSEIFHRRLDYLSLGFNSQGAGGAISDDGTVVFGTFAGQLIALKKGADRGRLEIMDYTPETPVSFGSNPAFPVTLPAIYTNTGCVTVTGTYTISTTSNGSLPGVSQWTGFDVVDRTASIADQLTAASKKAFKGSGLVTVSQETQVDASRSTLNQAALAVPVYLNDAAVNPLTVNPGDTFGLTFSVNQPLMPRGPNRFYVSFNTDDPDFFLNNVTEDPEITVTLVGGCLIDTTHLKFGAGSANLQAVANSGRLGTGDWNPTPGNIKILGDAVSFYQGTYVYGVTRNRIALNSQDWWSGGGEADSWISMQADQNRCNNDCKPALQTGVSLGSITTDGITYTPLTGNLVCKDYIDSVLVFDADGAGAALWNWLNFETAFFDNDSTMGLSVSTSTFGAVNVPAPYTMLNNVSVEVMKVKTRNGQAVNGWKFGCGIDYDVVNPDTTAIDRNISAAWTYGAGLASSTVWGVVKLPFGGGCAGSSYTPIKNAKALARAQSMTSPSSGGTARGNAFADSSYAWMSLAPGGYSQGSMHSADDQDAFYTFVENNFAAGGDSIQFAVAHFGMLAVPSPELSSNYAPLANLLNKWVGFGRGDINNDGAVNLADIIALADNVAGSGPGAIPFAHLGDVNGDGSVNGADVTYMVNYYFHYGPCPVGKFIIQ